ncbi:MAG: hypothetical protein AAF196_04180 [Planctomycetota bacterium]
MSGTLREFDCPCCGERLEIDTRSGKVRRLRPEAELDDLLARQKSESTRLDDAFEQARSEQSKQEQSFDEMLNDAAEKAKDDPNPPKRPFDLE